MKVLKKLDGIVPETAIKAEASLIHKRVAEIQEDIKNRFGRLPTDFDEKTFMDEGWEC